MDLLDVFVGEYFKSRFRSAPKNISSNIFKVDTISARTGETIKRPGNIIKDRDTQQWKIRAFPSFGNQRN